MFSLRISSDGIGIKRRQCVNMLNRGYPVGCAIPRMLATDANSPASMKETVLHIVNRYTTKQSTPTADPTSQCLERRECVWGFI